MKLIKQNRERDGSGWVTLMPEEEDDMWHAYNLILVGDLIKASTVRRVQSESAIGVSSERVHLQLTIQVTAVEFDAEGGQIRVNGKTCEESKHVKRGSFHTIDLQMNRNFSLHKDEWDSIFNDRIDEACNPMRFADVAAVVMQEGMAHVCLVTSAMTHVRAKIEHSIPRKRLGSSSAHDNGLKRFYQLIYDAIRKHLDLTVVKAVLVGSPAFVKNDFLEYMYNEAVRREDRVIIENKAKFVPVEASSGFKHAVKEILANENVQAQLADTKAARETQMLQGFFTMLQNDPSRAFYSYRHVEIAAKRAAIDVLMVSDGLFRAADVRTRHKYVALVDSVREQGAEVLIFSSQHVSGEQLMQLSGIAALLRFPLPEIEDMDLTDDEADSESDSDDMYPTESESEKEDEDHADGFL